uniref:COMM domain-containing protein n=1 Tax=Aedes albopictus TaxID=7160 RepID=A0A023EII4_AEDAL
MHDLLINVAKEDDIVQIIHLIIDHLLELPKSASTRAKLASALNLASASSEDLTVTLRLLENLLRQYCLGEINESELKAHFSNLSPPMQGALVEAVQLRKPEICQFLVNEINAKDHLLMESFDWDVKWIMGNSSLASAREQIATVVLNCRGKDQKLKAMRFEMSRERLAEVIGVLERCEGSGVDK